ncbi:hypothetical protein [Limnochorda pilosa]|uniref:Uncharacterized protein n=1 Tax=Limnochorda pilosa TaxID=1555112 RepID=A0A0K2SPN4_LIMPI|nr:hypothetical protein [Limnochorda pilosa]BAS28784.1 hypothetical protein LIP_2955 [Limnochorda pilosa]
MAHLHGRPGWVSLPEAAQTVGTSLPALRYLARRLALVLGVAQDDGGDTYLPASRLQDLRRAVSLRAQGYGPGEIEAFLAAPGAHASYDAGLIEPAPALAAGRAQPEPAGSPGRAPFQAGPAPVDEPSLPFPSRPSLRTPPGRRSRSQAHGARHELPFPSEDVRRELEALRRENQELRQRVEDLVTWLQARDAAAAPLRPPAAQAPAQPEGTQLTRTPSGNLRPAVVRSWNPPALNGRH